MASRDETAQRASDPQGAAPAAAPPAGSAHRLLAPFICARGLGAGMSSWGVSPVAGASEGRRASSWFPRNWRGFAGSPDPLITLGSGKKQPPGWSWLSLEPQAQATGHGPQSREPSELPGMGKWAPTDSPSSERSEGRTEVEVGQLVGHHPPHPPPPLPGHSPPRPGLVLPPYVKYDTFSKLMTSAPASKKETQPPTPSLAAFPGAGLPAGPLFPNGAISP